MKETVKSKKNEDAVKKENNTGMESVVNAVNTTTPAKKKPDTKTVGMANSRKSVIRRFQDAFKAAFAATFDSGTIYDDVIRSICERNLPFLIPLINRSTGSHFTRNASIVLLSNEHHDTLSHSLNLRVTDAFFQISENGITKKYHLECQSNGDSSMIVRIMEYDFLIAIDELAANIETGKYENELVLSETVVLYLRHSESMPEQFHVVIRHKDQTLDYTAPIIKAQTFSLDELEQEELYALLPFYLMRYEQQIKNNIEIPQVESEIEELKMRILTMEGDGRLNSYQAKQLLDYIARILAQLSKTSKSRERLMRHMRGNVIYTKADQIYDKGVRVGRKEGYSAGQKDGIALTKAVFRLDAEGYALSDIAVELSVSEEQVREILEE